jgi:opacity protein-like surface antigen
MKKHVLTALLALGYAGSVQAAFVVTGVTATASSWWDDPSPTALQHPSNLVNNSGLSTPDDITASHAWNNNAAGQWHARDWNTDPNPVVTFALGGVYDLVGIHIWNGNQPVNAAHIGRGVNEFVLSLSTNGGVSYTVVGTYHLAVSAYPPAQVNYAQSFALDHAGVTHVQLRVNSTHNAGNNDYAELAEVKFTAIPEPGITLLGGLGFLGLLRRRR